MKLEILELEYVEELINDLEFPVYNRKEEDHVLVLTYYVHTKTYSVYYGEDGSAPNIYETKQMGNAVNQYNEWNDEMNEIYGLEF